MTVVDSHYAPYMLGLCDHLLSQENERLYSELSRCQKESRAEQSQLFKENQRLASELLNVKYVWLDQAPSMWVSVNEMLQIIPFSLNLHRGRWLYDSKICPSPAPSPSFKFPLHDIKSPVSIIVMIDEHGS